MSQGEEQQQFNWNKWMKKQPTEAWIALDKQIRDMESTNAEVVEKISVAEGLSLKTIRAAFAETQEDLQVDQLLAQLDKVIQDIGSEPQAVS